MKDASARELIAGILALVAFVAGVIQLFYRPLAFAPVAVLALLIAVMMTSKYRTVYVVGVALLSVGFVVGAAIAVALERPLY